MLDKVKELLPLCAKQFDRLIDKPRWRRFHRTLLAAGAEREDFFFIQIGANDGVIHDPIHPYVTAYNWAGILVEPIPFYFEKLKENYRWRGGLIFENVAISDNDEARYFYRIREDVHHLPRWCKGIGSFYPEVLLKHRWIIPNIQDYMVRESVACVRFATLLRKHRVKKIDLLMIDTEGFDHEILKQIDFDTLRPAIIVYERKHMAKDNRQASERLLRSNHYELVHHISNTMAYVPITKGVAR